MNDISLKQMVKTHYVSTDLEAEALDEIEHQILVANTIRR